MDRPRRSWARIPGLSLIAAAALTVAVEAAIGIGAEISVASGLPVTAPNTSGVTSSVGSTASSVTSTAGSTVSSTASSASGAVSSTANSATSTASGAQQSLVTTASNLTSTASSTASSASQAASSAPAGPSAPATSSAPASAGPAGTGGSSAPSSGSQASATGQTGFTGRVGSSQSRSVARAVAHPWVVRRLVTRLSGCVAELPRRSQQVIVLAAGIGSGQPSSASRVARVLNLSASRERQIESSAIVSLQRTARQGCQSSGAALPVSAVAVGSAPGLDLITGPQAGARAFLPAARSLATSHRSALQTPVTGHKHSGGASGADSSVERSAIGSPSAARSLSAWVYVLLGLVVGGGFLLIGRLRMRRRPVEVAHAEAVLAAWTVSTPVSPALNGADAAAVWDPPGASTPRAPRAPDSPAALAADAPAPLAADPPPSPAFDLAAAFVPADFAPLAPEPPAKGAPAQPAEAFASSPPPVPAAPVSVSLGRPRLRTGREWLRRHRDAAGMVGAVAGGTLAMMASTAGRSARLVSRRHRQ